MGFLLSLTFLGLGDLLAGLIILFFLQAPARDAVRISAGRKNTGPAVRDIAVLAFPVFLVFGGFTTWMRQKLRF